MIWSDKMYFSLYVMAFWAADICDPVSASCLENAVYFFYFHFLFSVNAYII